ncbi:hypothetical protein Peur_071368 [Populus x canadensis]
MRLCKCLVMKVELLCLASFNLFQIVADIKKPTRSGIQDFHKKKGKKKMRFLAKST